MRLSELVRATDEVAGGGFTALADMAFLYASTHHWFLFSGGYQVPCSYIIPRVSQLAVCLEHGMPGSWTLLGHVSAEYSLGVGSPSHRGHVTPPILHTAAGKNSCLADAVCRHAGVWFPVLSSQVLAHRVTPHSCRVATHPAIMQAKSHDPL